MALTLKYLRRLAAHARRGGWRQARDFIHRERLRARNPVLVPARPRWPILPLPGTVTAPDLPFLPADVHPGQRLSVTTGVGDPPGRWVRVRAHHPVQYEVTESCRELQSFVGATVVASHIFNPWGVSAPVLPPLDPFHLPALEEAAGRAKIAHPGAIDPRLLITAPSTVTSWQALMHGPRHLRLILATIRPHRLPAIAAQLRALSLPPGITMSLTVGIHGEHSADEYAAPLAGLPVDHLVDLPAQWSLGRCLNHLIGLAPADILAKIDDDDRYHPEYLAEAIHALDFSGAAVVGKRSYPEITLAGGVEVSRRLVHLGLVNQYSNHVAGSSLVFRYETWQRHRFSDRTVGEDSHFLKAVVAARGLVYVTSDQNFAVTRHDEGHTWQPGEAGSLH